MTLRPFADFAGSPVSITVLIALLVALIPTTIGALLSAIGIAGMDRLVRRNVLALSGRAVEASGDVDVLLLDKTGTITLGNRQAAAFIPMPGVSEADLAEAAQLVLARRRDARGPLDRGDGQAVRPARARARPARRRVRAVHRPDAHERRRLRRHAPAQGRRRRDPALGRRRGRAGAARAAARGRPARPPGLDPARRRARLPGPRRDRAARRDQGRHARALRAAAHHGHPHGDGHRRQPPDRRQDRRGVRRRRLPLRGHARGEARPDPQPAGRRPPGRDDRRRHQRRARRSRRPTSAWP